MICIASIGATEAPARDPVPEPSYHKTGSSSDKDSEILKELTYTDKDV